VLRNCLPQLVALLPYGHSLLEESVRFYDFAASHTLVNDSNSGALQEERSLAERWVCQRSVR
jgi:hypothetical protein